LKFVVTVYDARKARLLKYLNCPADIIGGPKRIGKVLTHAALFEVSETMWKCFAQPIGMEKTLEIPKFRLNC